MLVVPALLSLKKSCIANHDSYIVKLIETVANKLYDPSEIVQKTAKKLLIELKRVYPDHLASIIALVSSRKLRNCCNTILDYAMESDSEDELSKPVQKIIQNNRQRGHNTPANIVTNEAPHVEPDVEYLHKQKKSKKVKNQFSDEKSKRPQIDDHVVVSRPAEQPKLVYENNSSPSNKPDISAAKTKPFKMRETPKKSELKRTLKQESPPNVVRSPESKNKHEPEIPKNKFNMNKFDDHNIKSLSNTQSFDVQPEQLSKK